VLCLVVDKKLITSKMNFGGQLETLLANLDFFTINVFPHKRLALFSFCLTSERFSLLLSLLYPLRFHPVLFQLRFGFLKTMFGDENKKKLH